MSINAHTYHIPSHTDI